MCQLWNLSERRLRINLSFLLQSSEYRDNLITSTHQRHQFPWRRMVDLFAYSSIVTAAETNSSQACGKLHHRHQLLWCHMVSLFANTGIVSAAETKWLLVRKKPHCRNQLLRSAFSPTLSSSPPQRYPHHWHAEDLIADISPLNALWSALLPTPASSTVVNPRNNAWPSISSLAPAPWASSSARATSALSLRTRGLS